MDIFKLYCELPNILASIGYEEGANLSNFWFNNRKDAKLVMKKINPVAYQAIELIIRWESDIGVTCKQSVVEFLKKIQLDRIEEHNKNVKKDSKGNFIFPAYDRGIIDFNKFSFNHEGNTYTLAEFAELFPTSRIGGTTDLRGINLSGIKIMDSEIRNANFNYADFSESNIQQVVLNNTYFIGASFEYSRLVMVQLVGSSLGNALFKGAFLNAIQLDDNNANGIKYSKVGFLDLLKKLFFCIFTKKSIELFPKKGPTTFLLVDVNALNKPENRQTKEYINWYQHILNNLIKYKELTRTERFSFSFSLLLTKCWDSYLVLAFWGLVVNILFSALFYINSSSFCKLNKNIFESFYYSVVTFTTIGYGEIYPIDIIGRSLVIVEGIIGYIVLGCFIFIIGHKAGKRY